MIFLGMLKKQSGLCLSDGLQNVPFLTSKENFKLYRNRGTELNDIRDLDESEGSYEFKHITAKDPEYKMIDTDERYKDFLNHLNNMRCENH